jgi:hypothetical protein
MRVLLKIESPEPTLLQNLIEVDDARFRLSNTDKGDDLAILISFNTLTNDPIRIIARQLSEEDNRSESKILMLVRAFRLLCVENEDPTPAKILTEIHDPTFKLFRRLEVAWYRDALNVDKALPKRLQTRIDSADPT